MRRLLNTTNWFGGKCSLKFERQKCSLKFERWKILKTSGFPILFHIANCPFNFSIKTPKIRYSVTVKYWLIYGKFETLNARQKRKGKFVKIFLGNGEKPRGRKLTFTAAMAINYDFLTHTGTNTKTGRPN